MQQIVDGGLRAVIQTNGITGSSIVALQKMDPTLYPPLKVPWTPKYFYVPSAPSQLGRLLASVDRTLANLEKLDVGRLSKSLDATLVSADAALRGSPSSTSRASRRTRIRCWSTRRPRSTRSKGSSRTRAPTSRG